MASREFERVMAAVAEHLQLESLEELGGDAYGIPLEDQPMMWLRPGRFEGELEVVCPLSVTLPKGALELTAELLQANLLLRATAGGVIGSRGSEHQLLYWRRLSWQQPLESLLRELEAVASMASLWAQKVQIDLGEEVESESPGPS